MLFKKQVQQFEISTPDTVSTVRRFLLLWLFMTIN